MGTLSYANSRYCAWLCVIVQYLCAFLKREAPRQVWMRGRRSSWDCSSSPFILLRNMQIKSILQTQSFKFIMALLQSQMTRYHQDIKPRLSNPTYASTNVGSTLGMHIPFIYRNIQNRYNVDVKPASRDNVPQVNQGRFAHRRSSSQMLSNVGSNSLKSLNRYISDKEVYEKQQKNYNIISVQPKEYQDTIKFFPKYRLQNEDQNYFKKLQLERQIASKLHLNKQQLRNSSMNPETAKKPMRGKYLNNVDEVADII